MLSTPSPRPAAPTPDRRRRHALRRTIRWTARLVVAAWSVVLLVWLSLHWLILPRLDDWRPEIQEWVGRAVGAPVRIGAIRARTGSWVPAFEVDDVRLLEPDGRVALRLGRVSAALAPRALLTLQPRFAQIHLEGLQLEVRRDAAGRVRVGGFDLDASASTPLDTRLGDWFFAQPEFVVRHATVRWTDEGRGAPPLELTDVDGVLRNGLRQHAFRIDAAPPFDWGDRFALRGRFTQPLTTRPGDWRRWSGRLFADLPRADADQLRRYVDLPFRLDAGRGALRAWVDIGDGRPTGGHADLALAGVVLRLGADLPPLQLERLQAGLTLQRTPDALDAAIEGLAFATDDGLPWAPTTLRLRLEQRAAAPDGAPAPLTGGALHADRVELGPLVRLAARLPLPSTLRRALAEMAPEGTLSALEIDWRGAPSAPTGYRLRTHASDLVIAAGPSGPTAAGHLVPGPGRPGVRGAAVDIDATEVGGRASLTIRQGALTFPGVFERSEVALRSLDAGLEWTVGPGSDDTPPAIEFRVREARFANADARGRFDARWRTGPGRGFGPDGRFPGRLELTGTLQEGDAARVARYLPLSLPESARRYVEQAVGSGELSDGRFEVDGDLWHFPFIDGAPGRFRIRSRVRRLQFAVVPPSGPGATSAWPALAGVGGEIEFDRASMRIRAAQAQLAGLALRDVRGGIDDLVHAPVLRLDGQGRGAAADLLRLVGATPIGHWLGDSLAKASATGGTDFSLALALPLHDAAATTTTVRGAVQFAGNDLRLRPDLPTLHNTRGRLDFTERGFSVVGGRARVFGGEATFEGGTQADGSVRLAGQGLATADGLQRSGELPLGGFAGTARRISGQTPYRAQIVLARTAAPDIQVQSSLSGLALDLPAPLGKPADVAWPMRLRIAADGGGGEAWTVDVADVLQARIVRGGVDPRWRRVSVGVGAPAPALPALGVAASVRSARLDVDAWQALARAFGIGAGAAGVGGDGAAPLPARVSLHSDDLRWGARRLHAVDLALEGRPAAGETLWVADLASTEAAGHIEWRRPRDGGPGAVVARLDRLAVPATPDTAIAGAGSASGDGAGVGVGVGAGAGNAPAPAPVGDSSLPAMDVVVQAFRWHGADYGRLEANAALRALPDGRNEWQLERLRLTSPVAALEAHGRWVGGRRVELDVGLDLTDTGRFAERLGAGNSLRGGRGRIAGALQWDGSPLSPEVASLDGRLRIELADGRFLNAEPGAARLLGVLSLQALPRRLLLDFRDVFQEGFGFDQITGDVTLGDGVAHSTNLRLVGVQAAVLIEGSADLRAETQDLRIVAVPEMNAGTASLAYAAINPAIGLGTFLAQWLLREPLAAAGTREFRVTGPWSDPRVERVERVAAASTPAGPSNGARPQGGTP